MLFSEFNFVLTCLVTQNSRGDWLHIKMFIRVFTFSVVMMNRKYSSVVGYDTV